ncbi:MAG: tripartite tricarboxylate transporter substrate binding protein [Pseudomonadota bacterium]
MKLLSSLMGLVFLAHASMASAQVSPEVAKLKPANFPTQPIEFTIVYPAGGGMDLSGRLLGKYTEKVSGDKILVNNRTGGAGMVGHAYLATQAKPDGYTVGVVANLLWGDAMLRSQGKWIHTDLEPIAYINSDPLTWVSSTEGPYKGMSAKQIIQIAKDKPGTVRIAVVPGSMWEYLVEQVETSTGAKFLRVPFQGGGPGVVALLGGNVDVAQGFYGEFRGHMDAGKIVPIAIASNERTPYLKNTPTFNEIYGTKDYVWNIIRFAVVPKGTPADRKAYLAAAIQTALKDPELIAEYQKLGAYFDPALVKSTSVAADVNALAQREREFYVKTGRLK